MPISVRSIKSKAACNGLFTMKKKAIVRYVTVITTDNQLQKQITGFEYKRHVSSSLGILKTFCI